MAQADNMAKTAPPAVRLQAIRLMSKMPGNPSINLALRELVEALAQADAPSAATLNILPQLERGELLEQFNDTAKAYPQGQQLVHQLFEAAAAQQPDAIALAYEDE